MYKKLKYPDESLKIKTKHVCVGINLKPHTVQASVYNYGNSCNS